MPELGNVQNLRPLRKKLKHNSNLCTRLKGALYSAYTQNYCPQSVRISLVLKLRAAPKNPRLECPSVEESLSMYLGPALDAGHYGLSKWIVSSHDI